MENNSIYYLVLENKPGDFTNIDITELGYKFDNKFSNLVNYDEFTKTYNEKTFKELIAEKNIVTDNYLNGKFYLYRDVHKKNMNKHNVIWEDTFKDFDLYNLLVENLEFKEFSNNIYNVIVSIVHKNKEIYGEDIEIILNKIKNILHTSCEGEGIELKRSIFSKTYEFLKIIREIDRVDQRKLLIYIKENMILENTKPKVRELSSVA